MYVTMKGISYVVIIRVRVVLKRTVVGDLSRSHLQSQVNINKLCYPSECNIENGLNPGVSVDDFCSGCRNVAHKQQSFSELLSPGQLQHTNY